MGLEFKIGSKGWQSLHQGRKCWDIGAHPWNLDDGLGNKVSGLQKVPLDVHIHKRLEKAKPKKKGGLMVLGSADPHHGSHSHCLESSSVTYSRPKGTKYHKIRYLSQTFHSENMSAGKQRQRSDS